MLEVKNLSKRYGEKQALRSVSFSIQGREAVGFLGINGAGKTTTMNILTGYISASDGDVVIDGIDVLTDPLKAKTRIGYLPEQPPVYGDMRVDEYLNFIYQLKKVKKNKAIRQDREEYLQGIMELVGITDVSKRMIRNLSKGYKQRVGLAQALRPGNFDSGRADGRAGPGADHRDPAADPRPCQDPDGAAFLPHPVRGAGGVRPNYHPASGKDCGRRQDRAAG